jgi:two-component system LytT family response regulator
MTNPWLAVESACGCNFPDVKIVGECGDGESAVDSILSLEPDLVFLDVQMPGVDGFDVLRALPAVRLPAVIFLTAHEEHALRALEGHALDYLLKPLDDERLAAAVNRAQKQLDTVSKAEMVGRMLGLLDQTANNMHLASSYERDPGSKLCPQKTWNGLQRPRLLGVAHSQ